MQILNFEIKEDVTFWMLNDIDRGKHNEQHNFQIQERWKILCDGPRNNVGNSFCQGGRTEI